MARVYGAFAAAANQVDGPSFVSRFTRNRLGKLHRIRLKVRVFVPGNVLYARWATHIQRFNLHAHVDKQCVGVILDFKPSGSGF